MLGGKGAAVTESKQSVSTTQLDTELACFPVLHLLNHILLMIDAEIEKRQGVQVKMDEKQEYHTYLRFGLQRVLSVLRNKGLDPLLLVFRYTTEHLFPNSWLHQDAYESVSIAVDVPSNEG